jgi:hypothetical protein
MAHALAFDGARGRAVMFGGMVSAPERLVAETWEWDGSDWTLRQPSHSPSARERAAMVWDEVSGRVVLFGGAAGALPLGDTWMWDGIDWRMLAPPTSPPPRSRHALVWDAARRRAVLIGGLGQNDTPFGDTWEWDGFTWSQRMPLFSPEPRHGYALVYDAVRERVLLSGGSARGWLGDTWEYFPAYPARFDIFGDGCRGTTGIPGLRVTAGLGPWSGERCEFELQNLPSAGAGLVWLGFSRTKFAGIPLPLDLTPAGMTGCSLRVSAELALPAPGARTALAIPGDPVLLGLPFFAQASVVDPPANTLGVTLSEAGEGRIGAK